MSLAASTIIAIQKRAVNKFGGIHGIRDQAFIDNLETYVEETTLRYGWDLIESFCLAAYQIIKIHPFLDANKRTGALVLMNCLRKEGYHYTGRPKDLANKIIEMAVSPANKKEEAILNFSYFLKSRLQ